MTIRRWMLVVIGLALVLGLIAPAVRVWFDPAHRHHYHVYANPSGDLTWSHPNPFWPRYRSHLIGRPWDGDMDCGEDVPGKRLEETAPPRVELEGDKLFETGDDLAAIQMHLRR